MAKQKVTVVGAGITGLTVAHELMERGFDVTVVEKNPAAFEDGCQVGGMARTQWCLLPQTAESFNDPPPTMVAAEPMTRLGEALAGWIPFDSGSYAISGKARTALDAMGARLKAYSADLRRSGDARLHLVIVQGYATDGETPSDDEIERILGDQSDLPSDIAWEARRAAKRGESSTRRFSRIRAAVVAADLYAQIKEVDANNEPLTPYVLLTPVGLGSLVDPLDPSLPQPGVSFSLYEAKLPGEHGYRYFPAFYRHVFDSMRRTPTLERRALRPVELERDLEVNAYWKGLGGVPLPSADIESMRTVFDNLVPTFDFAIAGGKRPPAQVPRTRVRSLREVRRLLQLSFEDLGIEARDILLFELKILEYMTSSPERRARYEEVTWWEFLGADRFSAAFQRLIERWPQSLVGVRAKVADARTIGTVSVQLLLDQLTTTGLRDATLNGPTSSAWLDPWKRYLEKRKVSFSCGTLAELKMDGGRLVTRWNSSSVFQLDEGYLVLALPLVEAKRLVEGLWDSATLEERDRFSPTLRALHEWDVEPASVDGGIPVTLGEPTGPLRLYSGIQFYLNRDLGPANGHLYFATSAWGLSAISQAQFWRQRLIGDGGISADPLNEYLSVLSVDIGDWLTPVTDPASAVCGKSAAQCTRDELAREVWRQIEEGIQQRGWQPHEPIGYHVDDDVIYRSRAPGEPELPVENRAPYLVNRAGDWKKRPGDLSISRYDVFEGLVLAGTFMKTHTRLVTMEAANESGRRAANAVLAHCAAETGVRLPQESPIWDPEDFEVDDLDFLKDLDRALFERGLPHVLEILDVARLVDGSGGVELSPQGIVEGVLAGLGAPGATFAAREAFPVQLIRRALAVIFGEDR